MMSSQVEPQSHRDTVEIRDVRSSSIPNCISNFHAVPKLESAQNKSYQRSKIMQKPSVAIKEELKFQDEKATDRTNNITTASPEQQSSSSSTDVKLTLLSPCSNILPSQTQTSSHPNVTSPSACSLALYPDPAMSPIISFFKQCTNGMYSNGALLTSNNQLCQAPFALSQAAAVSISVNYLEQLTKSMLNQTVNGKQIATHSTNSNSQCNEHLENPPATSVCEDRSNAKEKVMCEYNPTSKDNGFIEGSANNVVHRKITHKKTKLAKSETREKLNELTATRLCEICSDVSSGFHCNAFVCEACKKFFIRSCKGKGFLKYTCPKDKQCEIDKFNRTICQFCRYQKCCQANMTLPGVSTPLLMDKGTLPCRVCEAPSSGFHFGAFTCEGCKGFFRRSLQECEKRQYVCNKGGNCVMSPTNRNNCKACRFVTCQRAGMCREGSRIGRQPNALKFLRYQEMEKMTGNENFTNDCINLSGHSESSQTLSNVKLKERPERSMSHSSLDGSPPCKVSRMDSDPSSSNNSPEESVQTPRSNHDNAQADVPADFSIKFTIASTAADELKESEILDNPLNVPLAVPKKLPGKMVKKEDNVRSMTVLALSMIEDKDKAAFINSCVEAASSLWSSLDQSTSNWDPHSHPKLHDLWRIMMKHFEIHTVNITNFAKKVPGFDKLHLKDKKTVVKDSLYPIILLCLSRDFNHTTKEYNYFDFSPKERDLILQMFPSFQKIGQHLCESGQLLQSYKLSHVEVALLSTVALYKREKSNLQEPEKVKALCQNALDTLIYYEENVSGSPLRSADLINALSLLSRMNEEHHNIVRELKSLRPELQFPKLYTEVFHL